MFTKSGLMVGLGETREEVLQVMDDLRAAGVDFITIGQYLQPSQRHAAIDRFWTPDEFNGLAEMARGKGLPAASKCCWPIYCAKFSGRIRAASG